MTPDEQNSYVSQLSDAEANRLTQSLSNQDNGVLSTVGTAISNIPSSAINMVGNIANAVIHPVDTVKGIGTLGAGLIDLGARKLESAVTGGHTAESQPGWEQARAAASSAGDFYANRYGGAQNTLNTFKNDPVGMMSDVSSLLGLGSGTLKLAGLKNASQATMQASNAVNPINLMAKAISPAVKNIVPYVVGQTTGSGMRTAQEAMKNKKDFVDAIKGNLTDEEVLKNSANAIQSMKDARSAAYQTDLTGLKNAAQDIPIDNVKNIADGWLKRYGVQKVNGELDFSRSTLKDVAANEVKSIYDDVTQWGTKQGDLTPLGLDTLKRRIQNNFVQNSQSRAMATSLSNAVKENIVKEVPSYAKMTSDYEKASSVINSIEYALSTKNPTHADTALRKIMTAMRQDTGFRRSMLDTLDSQTGSNIAAQAAGRVMSSPYSNRLGSMLTNGAGIAAVLHNPMMFPLFALASPRVMGEFLRHSAAMSRTLGKIPKPALLVPERAQAIQQNQ
jgi:hypothetical protein